MNKPGFLDNLIARINPEAAYRREAFRQAYDMMRSYYDAGGYDRPNQNWRAQNASAEMTDRFDRDQIKARARDLERNSDIMNSVVGPFRRNVVGKGYALQAKTDDEDLNGKIEKLWRQWCKARNCDVTGTQNLNAILRMAEQRKRIDGGILFIKRYTADGLVPFKLQMMETDELDITTMTPHRKGDKVVGGIEYNQYNKAVGYFIRQYDIDGYTMRDPVYLEAKDVIFYFTKKRPSQLREISDVAQTLSRIRDTNEFMLAVAVKERIEACLSVFIKRTFPTSGLGRSNGQGEQRQSYEGKTISPGMIHEMNVGDDVSVVNPSGQGTDATNFTKLQQHMIAAGQGISYEATSRDMSQSTYSSARQGLIEDEQTYEEDKEQLIEILDEIYETFVISAVLSGKLEIRDFWTKKESYFEHGWVRSKKQWIDPKKESEATATALKTGQQTFQQVAAENGSDWRQQLDDIAEVVNYGESVGLDMRSILFGKTTQRAKKDEEQTG